MNASAISPKRSENYPEWYQQVVKAADLAESSPVRGCMVIKPWGYAIWENIQQDLDKRLKATGHLNAYFPLLIPLSHLEKEAEHIDGFAKECAVVTHHRLVDDGHGKLKPDGKLEEPFIIRPTSETMIGTVFSKWVQSYRDLPLLINQWANVMRWEMRTRLFLRTSEFLWQEGHTAHASAEEAKEETLKMLEVYAEFLEEVLALPVIKGEKTKSERFPGAVSTYCVEAMMQDGKALQAGTSHFLGQTFSKAYDIEFLDQQGVLQHAWTTSWGVSTRLIGGLIMSHSDDDGLVLPPRVAPYQVVILPIMKKDSDVKAIETFCKDLAARISEKQCFGGPIRVHLDKRDIRGGEKKWSWIKKGVPVLLEIGERDIEKNSVTLLTRDQQKHLEEIASLPDALASRLVDIQSAIFQAAKKRHDENIVTLHSFDEFKALFSETIDDGMNNKFAYCFAKDSEAVESLIKPFKVTARCIPLVDYEEEGACIFTGERVKTKMIFAKAY